MYFGLKKLVCMDNRFVMYSFWMHEWCGFILYILFELHFIDYIFMDEYFTDLCNYKVNEIFLLIYDRYTGYIGISF